MISVKQKTSYLTTQDLADLFGRSPTTIRYWLHHCHLNRYGERFGRDWVFTPEELLHFLEEEMSTWYADKQWVTEHRRLRQIKARLLRLFRAPERDGRRKKAKVTFQSYSMGPIQGSLRRMELYRDRPGR